MRDEQVRVGNSNAEMQKCRYLAPLLFCESLLHTCNTGWMSRNSKGNYVVDELDMYVQGRYAR